MMNKLVLVVGIVVAAGCSGSGGEIAKLREAKDKVCACADARCKVEASRDIQDLSQKLRDSAANLSAGEREEIAKISRELVDCARNAR